MIRTSKAPVAWPVPWDKSQTLFLRAGDVIERGEFEGELAGEYRAGRVLGFLVDAAFEEGVTALLAESPDDATQILEWARAEDALGVGETLPAAEAQGLAEARDTVAEHWPAYRRLIAQEKRRREMAPIVAFRWFCTGWEGDGLPAFARGGDGRVSLAAMAELEPLLIQAAGMEAHGMLYPGADLAKNSAPASPSDEGPATSTSDTAPADGSSAAEALRPAQDKRAPAIGGRKTRSPASRPGRSRSSTSGSTADG